MKRWILALLFVAAAGVAVTGMTLVTPVAEADTFVCSEPPDCIGSCICEQHAAEMECRDDYEAGLLTGPQYRQCLSQSRIDVINCFRGCSP